MSDETTELVARIPDTGAECMRNLRRSTGRSVSLTSQQKGAIGRTVNLTTPQVSRQVVLADELIGKSN